MMDQIFDQFDGGLPLSDGDAWPEVERAPVSMAVPWTEPGPPAPETIADDMRSRAGRTVELLGVEMGPEDSGLLWSAVFSVEGLTAPIFVWMEETDAPTAQHASDMAGVPEHQWTMVWQTRLDGKDAVADWGMILRPLACLGPELRRFMISNSRDGLCAKRLWSLFWPTQNSSPRWNHSGGFPLRSVNQVHRLG